MYNTRKPGQWETVKSKADEKKKRSDDKKATKEVTRDRLGIAVDDPLTAFDRSFAREEAAKAKQQQANALGAFAALEDEAPPQQLQEDVGSGDDQPAASNSNNTGALKKPKQPKAPKKPKLSVAQVAAGVELLVCLTPQQEHAASNSKCCFSNQCHCLLVGTEHQNISTTATCASPFSIEAVPVSHMTAPLHVD